jgi:hypothetical protein
MYDIGFDILGIGSGIILHYYIFDKKNIKSGINFNVSDHRYLAIISICF